MSPVLHIAANELRLMARARAAISTGTLDSLRAEIAEHWA